MTLWAQIKKTSTDFALMLVFGSLGALIPALFGWWVLPAFGVLCLVALLIVKAFGLIDRRILKQQQSYGERSGSHS